jgi:hypothetical protein
MTELAGLPNPFRDNVVQDAWQSPPDVPDIHDGAFRACLSGVDSATRGVPDSLLIYGPAGSGKTHLLTRVQRYLAETARSAPDQVLRCVFSFVRLQTNPLLLWQHLRRRFASDLMRRDQGLTQLQRLIAHQVGIVSGRSPRAGVLELRVLGAEDSQTMSKHLAEVASRLDLPRDLCVVLELLLGNRQVRDAAAWLGGDSLPESVLAELGLGPDLEEDREQAAREVVTALCRLAGETLPIVFCFDQVEALQRSATDEEALFRFGRMAADLHDSDANVFLITCLQSALLEQLRRAVRAADLDRMARRHAVLEELGAPQVQRLVQSRLAALPGLAPLRAAHAAEAYYPFGERLVQQLASQSPCVPRRVLAAAARAFEEVQHGRSLGPPTTSQFLGDELATRGKQRQGSLQPSDTTRIVFQGAPVIAALEQATILDVDPESADLLIEGPRRTALSLRNEADGRSLGPKLKKLLSHTPRKDGARTVIVRDPRLPIAKTALKVREHLAELERRGATLVEPSVEALAALDALASLLSDAKSGDLAHDGEPVTESAVLAWLRGLRGDLGAEPVSELVESLLGDGPSQRQDDVQDLVDLLAHEHVIEVDLAARIVGASRERVLSMARRSAAHFLLLEGPPAVLLDVSGVLLEEDAS